MSSTFSFIKPFAFFFLTITTMIHSSNNAAMPPSTATAINKGNSIEYIAAFTAGSLASYMLCSILEACLALMPISWQKIPLYAWQIGISFLTIPLACKMVTGLKKRFEMISHYWIVQKIVAVGFVATATYLLSFLLLLIPSATYAHFFVEVSSIPPLLAEVITFFLNYYRYVIGISLLINTIGFGLGYLFHTDQLTDLSYSLTFLSVSSFLYWYWSTHTNGLVGTGSVYAVIVLWAVRLGAFLFMRIRHQKKDDRFDKMRGSFVKFGGFWLLQAVSVCIILLSTILFFRKTNNNNGTPYSLGWLGLSLFGLFFESIADLQKYSFKKNPANKGKFIQTGLWHYSRHPNYLGEILFWLGIYLTQLHSLGSWEITVGGLAPFMITTLLLLVSGIPLLEYKADAKWGNDPDYQAYKNRTSGLVPFL